MFSERDIASGSPHSSEKAVVSGINTPDTKMTVYSREELQVPLAPFAPQQLLQSSDGRTSFSVNSSVDPFLGSPFSPLSSVMGGLHRFSLGERKHSTSQEYPARTVQFAGLTTPNTGSRLKKQVSNKDSLASPFSDPRINLRLSGDFAELPYLTPRSRGFVVEGVASPEPLTLANFFKRRDFESIQGPYLSELKSTGKFVVMFTDIRDTQRALDKVQVAHPEWRVTPLLVRECSQQSKGLIGGVSDYEGQVLAKVIILGLELTQVDSFVHRLFEAFGPLAAFKPLSLHSGNIKEFVIEFCDTTDATNMVAALNGASIGNLDLVLSHIRPDVETTSGSLLQKLMNTQDSPPQKKSPPFQIGGCARDHSYVLSPTGRSTVPMDDVSDYACMLTPAQKAASLDSIPPHLDVRFPEQRSKHPQNVVDVKRIRMGQDVRTTIMLRNIPNKVDLSLLKTIVDETSFGKYDFMYLRIDFANNCNVGYAFINFEDPVDIIDFVEARAGHTWNCFNSDKVAEVSYATIQGRDCLIQKFRNSSVMLEDPSFRPKLFYTGTGPLAGTEEPFPKPDNMSKMRRSVENAEQVGLFAPRMNRDSRRGSAYRLDLSASHHHHQNSPPQSPAFSTMDSSRSTFGLRRAA